MFSEYMNKTVSKQFGIKSPKGLFGIEIETEGAGLAPGAITKYFNGKADGSLRNGMEYISCPLLREQVQPTVEELQATLLNVFGARLNPSYRSSTHIHLNMCDRTFRDVLGMMVVWSLVEPTVFRLMPPGRDGSLFCVSSYDSGELADFTDRMCEEIGQDFKRHGFMARGKYSALNLSRLGPSEHHALGTLEYRVFPTSMNGTEIKGWCDWLFEMSHLVSKEEDHSFLTMVRNAEQNPLPFLTQIFGKLPVPEGEAGELVDFGARTAYEMARVIDKHLKTKPRKKAVKEEVVQAQPVPGFQRRARRRAGNADGGLPQGAGGINEGQRPAGRIRPIEILDDF